MPLKLSRTTRSINSWTPSGGGIQGVFKKDVDPFESAVPSPRSYDPQKVIRKEPRAVTLELNGLKPEKPETQELKPPADTPTTLTVNHNIPASTVQQKPPLRRGRKGQIAHHFTDPNLPLRHICVDPSLEVGSSLVLARSTQSLAHLRKWNSQHHLDPAPHNQKSRELYLTPVEHMTAVKRHSLSWNVSLPDIREAVTAERQRLRRPRRQDVLLRTPSDVGRTLAFWILEANGEGHVESFDVLSSKHRNKYKHKISLLRSNLVTKSSHRNGSSFSYAENGLEPTEILASFTPQALAQELTLLDREMLLAVETAELVTFVMRPMTVDEESCPNLVRLVHFYERMAALVVTEVLSSEDAASRAQILSMFVETADLCRGHNNRQSMAALMAGIRSPSIARLRQTWARLRNAHSETYSKYESMVIGTSSAGTDGSQLCSVTAFSEIVGRIRGRPKVSYIRPRRRPWKEPPSLAKWVEEQTTVPASCDTCATSGGHHPCCYLLVFVLGRNFFCPVRKMPPEGSEIENKKKQQQIMSNGDSRENLAKSFDDPDALPFASRHIQCCALQPQALHEVLRRAELCLRSAQASARVYDFPVNKSARHYLLNKTYSSFSENMDRSLQVEPKRVTRFGIS